MLIHYVSGSRADFGLVEKCLQRIHSDDKHELGIVVTGQHLLEDFGNTVDDIIASDLRIIHKIPVVLKGASGQEMGRALATEIDGLLKFWGKHRPNLVLILGDRGEMLAAALAAVHLGIHVAHIHGGERSGTIDESFRHAITKLAHIHFPATKKSAERLEKMGELSDCIFTIGAPGLVGINDVLSENSSDVSNLIDVNTPKPLALCIYHPVFQETHNADVELKIIIETLLSEKYRAVVFRPNSDSGSLNMNKFLDTLEESPDLKIITHLERNEYLNLLKHSDLIIGNSSSGIIESASFNTVCVNIGTRQRNRERNANTIDVTKITKRSITEAIREARANPNHLNNVYGDGFADKYLANILDTLDLSRFSLSKELPY